MEETNRAWVRVGLVLVAFLAALVLGLRFFLDDRPLDTSLAEPALAVIDRAKPANAGQAGSPQGSEVKCAAPANLQEARAALREGLAQRDEALAAAAAALRRSVKPAEQALGLHLQLESASLASIGSISKIARECAGRGADCHAAILDAIVDGTRAPMEEIARQAMHTDDPVVYATAYLDCQAPVDAASACHQLSAAQWARLEPDNAAAWLALAGEAERAGDVQGRNDAVFRAAGASAVDMHRAFFAQALQRPELAAQAPGVRAGIAGQLGITASIRARSHAAPALASCGRDGLQDANRRQVCEQLAALLVDRSDSVDDLGTGRKLGEGLGWSTARLDELRDREDAVLGISTGLAQQRFASDCSPTEPVARREEDILQLGQIGAERYAIAYSGISEHELAETAREQRARNERELQKAMEEIRARRSQAQIP